MTTDELNTHLVALLTRQIAAFEKFNEQRHEEQMKALEIIEGVLLAGTQQVEAELDEPEFIPDTNEHLDALTGKPRTMWSGTGE